MNSQPNPYEENWPVLKEIFESDGAEALVTFITSRSELLERRALFLMSSQRISRGQDLARNLDDVITISRAAIDEFHRQSTIDDEPEQARLRLEGANILSYNLAADLAPCWVDDDENREKRHFEEGLRCAQDCIRWREQLEKGAVALSMAWWAEGVHNAGLGSWGLACESFQSALDAAKDDARENGAPETVGPDSSFSVNIASGWLEFARWRNGDSTSYDRFLEAMGAFSKQIDREDEGRDEALIGVQQLQIAAQRLSGKEQQT